MNVKLLVLAVLATIASGACEADEGTRMQTGYGNGDADADTDSDADGDTDGDADSDYKGGNSLGCDKMDILFVIDDSGSMECEQNMLIQVFPEFIGVLESFSNKNADQINYRVGVTSTGKTAVLRQKTGIFPIDTPMEGLDGALNAVQGARWIDGPGDQGLLSSRFSQMASLGAGGPGYEMPLEALRMAIEKDAPQQPNSGFLRQNSLFIAVIISDEDDCSRLDNPIVLELNQTDDCLYPQPSPHLVDLGEYKDFLDSRFGGSDGYAVISIAGESTCDGSSYPITCPNDQSGYAGARQARRLYEFVHNYVNDGKSNNGLFADICTSDMPRALEQALDKMEMACDAFPAVE